MIAQTYLAEVAEPALGSLTSDCLTVYLPSTAAVPTCLTDPEVIGFHPALGHWCLLGIDRESNRAFYTRFEHTTPLTCESAG